MSHQKKPRQPGRHGRPNNLATFFAAAVQGRVNALDKRAIGHWTRNPKFQPSRSMKLKNKMLRIRAGKRVPR